MQNEYWKVAVHKTKGGFKCSYQYNGSVSALSENQLLGDGQSVLSKLLVFFAFCHKKCKHFKISSYIQGVISYLDNCALFLFVLQFSVMSEVQMNYITKHQCNNALGRSSLPKASRVYIISAVVIASSQHHNFKFLVVVAFLIIPQCVNNRGFVRQRYTVTIWYAPVTL